MVVLINYTRRKIYFGSIISKILPARVKTGETIVIEVSSLSCKKVIIKAGNIFREGHALFSVLALLFNLFIVILNKMLSALLFNYFIAM